MAESAKDGEANKEEKKEDAGCCMQCCGCCMLCCAICVGMIASDTKKEGQQVAPEPAKEEPPKQETMEKPPPATLEGAANAGADKPTEPEAKPPPKPEPAPEPTPAPAPLPTPAPAPEPAPAPAPAPAEPPKPEVFLIENKNASGYYLHLYYGGTDDGTKAEIYHDKAAAATKWMFRQVDGDIYNIESANAEGKFLHVLYGQTRDGAAAEIYHDKAAPAASWRVQLVPGTTDTYTIENAKAAGKYLHVSYGAKSDGARVEIYKAKKSASAQWHIRNIDSGEPFKMEASPEAPAASDPNILEYLTAAGCASYGGDNVAEAAQLGALSDVVRLVEAGSDINAAFDYGFTALHHLASVPGVENPAISPEAAVAMMDWLLDHGAAVNQGDEGGKTPLHVFGKYGGIMDQLHVLHDYGADVNQTMNGDSWTPLWYARNYKSPAWQEAEVTLLVLGGEQVPAELEDDSGLIKYDGQNVAEAAKMGAVDAVVQLAKNRDVDLNVKLDNGYTALHYLAAVPSENQTMKPEVAAVLIRWLCTHGAHVNDVDKEGKTPLHIFGKCGCHIRQLLALVENGADVNKTMNGDSWTPLWCVRNYKNPAWKEAEAILVDLGATQVPDELEPSVAAGAAPTQPVFITWKEWETTVQIGEEKLDDGFGSFDEGPRVFYTFADEQPGTKEFSIGDVKFFAYTEEKPGMVQHTICSAFMKWWVGPVGMDKGGREESGDGWELTDTFWAPQGDSPAPAPQEAMTSIVGNIQMNGVDQYLHLAYGATDNATNVEIYEKCTEWKIEQVPPTTDYDPGTDNDSSYTIEASGSGKFVHLSHGKTDNATNIELYEKPSHWRFVQCEESSDTYLIESAYEGGKGKYLHTAYSEESNGTNVELYEVGSKWCIPGFKPA